MNSTQRRKIFRKTGKTIQMNTLFCFEGHKARPTEIGFWCPKCQQWGRVDHDGNTPEKLRELYNEKFRMIHFHQ